MKLVLRKDIPKLGLCGEIVTVSAGYARNYLLPHHLALEPTRDNLKKIEEDKKIAAVERERRHAMLREMGQKLEGAEVTISAACNREGHLYGSVGPREIARELMEEGFTVHPDQIRMSHNIKEIGTLDVPVVFADDIRPTIKVWVVAEKGSVLDEESEQEKSEPEAGPDTEVENVQDGEPSGSDADASRTDTGSAAD